MVVLKGLIKNYRADYSAVTLGATMDILLVVQMGETMVVVMVA